jgi:hypothetical protein
MDRLHRHLFWIMHRARFGALLRGHSGTPAYSWLLAGQAQVGGRWLDLAAEGAGAYARQDIEEGLYGENEEHPLLSLLERVARVRDALAGSAQDALAVLERWRQATGAQLGLSQHLEPARTRASR